MRFVLLGLWLVLWSFPASGEELLHIVIQGQGFQYWSAAKSNTKNKALLQELKQGKSTIEAFCVFRTQLQRCGRLSFDSGQFNLASIVDWPLDTTTTLRLADGASPDGFLLALTRQYVDSPTLPQRSPFMARSSSDSYIWIEFFKNGLQKES